ncbi:hypothetical protein KM043_008106 [Ampulex compressa]|nr:hypothetical protein KM043_008106 [Ampulex compressa]
MDVIGARVRDTNPGGNPASLPPPPLLVNTNGTSNFMKRTPSKRPTLFGPLIFEGEGGGLDDPRGRGSSSSAEAEALLGFAFAATNAAATLYADCFVPGEQWTCTTDSAPPPTRLSSAVYAPLPG